MLHRISVDCGLPGSSSLVVRPALWFVVVGRATDRVLKRKVSRLSPLAQRHSGPGKNPSGARGKLTAR